MRLVVPLAVALMLATTACGSGLPSQSPSPTSLYASQSASPSASPGCTPSVYTVKGGDTLLGIAVKFNLGLSDVVTANDIKDPDTLAIGQVVKIPCPTAATTTPGGATAAASPTDTPSP